MSSAPSRFSWRRYINVAKELAKNADEAWCRTSINRSYYAAFSVAKDFIDGRSTLTLIPATAVDTSGNDYHKRHWDSLEKQADHTHLRQAGVQGNRLRLKRADADYKDATMRHPRYEAQQAVLLSERILGHIDEQVIAEQGPNPPYI